MGVVAAFIILHGAVVMVIRPIVRLPVILATGVLMMS
jgi:hypothetical protein